MDEKTESYPLCSNCKHPAKFCICPDGCIDWEVLKKGLEDANRRMEAFREGQKIDFKTLHEPFTI